ncbi:hypothetical protein DP73_11590 [Desulfosporosinus sp. HMP52]|nr:hypothetical protein DP73_11590 [Desulfosporosinus sp. HMP52]
MDLTALWEEDGDLQRMKTFFQSIEVDSAANEKIKLSVKQKALEKMSGLGDSRESLINAIDQEKVISQKATQKVTLSQKIRTSLLSMSNFGHWKLGISVAALALFVIIGQEAMNGSGNILPRMGSSMEEKSTQSAGSSPQDENFNLALQDSMNMNQEIRAKGKMPSNSAEEDTAPQAEMQFSMDSTSAAQNKEILPVPPDQTDAPPADPELARKITHNLDLTLEVAAIKDSVNQISQEVQQLGGYVVTSQQSESDHYSTANLTVKIPSDKLSGMQDSFSAWGKVLDQRLQANDITNEYYDSQARLTILEAEENRYLEILAQAVTVDDVLKVEGALSNVRQQIEQLKGQLKLWNHQVDYSTVTIQIVTRQSPNLDVTNPWQPISWTETWRAAGDAVLKTLSSTWNGLNYLVVGIGYASPYLLVGALGWSIYRLWRKRTS